MIQNGHNTLYGSRESVEILHLLPTDELSVGVSMQQGSIANKRTRAERNCWILTLGPFAGDA